MWCTSPGSPLSTICLSCRTPGVTFEQLPDRKDSYTDGRLKYTLGFGGRQGDRLLHEGVLTSLEDADRQLRAGRHVRGHFHRIETWIGQRASSRSVNRARPRRNVASNRVHATGHLSQHQLSPQPGSASRCEPGSDPSRWGRRPLAARVRRSQLLTARAWADDGPPGAYLDRCERSSIVPALFGRSDRRSHEATRSRTRAVA
jgi:hypothetical protein